MGQSISCAGVSKVFEGDGVATNALQNVNLHFEEGEFVAIVGPSGSGKSTLLSLIGTLDRPTEGSLFFGGQNVNELKNAQLADFRFQTIGFIFQQFHLLPTLTALENVMVPLLPRRGAHTKRERAYELLQMVGLDDKMNSLPSQLSGGQQQRVAIARALIQEPDWLLADEPTGNLDSGTGEIIYQLLSRFNREKGCGVIIVTHDSKLAERADRIIEMKDGSVLSDSKVSQP